jgi:hypothetical protein
MKMDIILAKKIKEHHKKILDHYGCLDTFLYAHPILLPELDNNNNLYAHSCRLMLFDTFERLIKNSCNFSFLDLTIRFIHFAFYQCEMFDKVINKYPEYEILKYYRDIIREELILTIRELLKIEDSNSLPKYLQEWVNANIEMNK